MLDHDELLWVYRTLLRRLQATRPDYIVVEIADGSFQRETRTLLESREVRDSVDHLFFAATDSLAAECGVRRLREAGWPLRAVAGVVTASPLAAREVEGACGVPCLSVDQLLDGRLLAMVGGAGLLARAVSGAARQAA